MLISEAFRHYDAKLKNIQWSVSAFNSKRELVLSLWAHKFVFDKLNKTQSYVDRASRWSGPGSNEFRANIERAYRENLTVRAVIAQTNEAAAIDAGETGANRKNKFSVKRDWVGRITSWDGDEVEILFS